MTASLHRSMIGLAALALVAGACTSSDTGVVNTEPPVTDVAAPATEPPTTAPSTQPPESTQITTTSTSTTTTTAPTSSVIATTTEPDDFEIRFTGPDVEGIQDIYDELVRVVLADHAILTECLELLPNCDPQAFLTHRTEEVAEALVGTFEGFNRDGFEARRVDGSTFRIERVVVNSALDIADVFTCDWDDSEVFRPATNDASEQVQSSGFDSFRRQYRLRLEDGEWRITGTQREEQRDGVNICLS